MTLCLVTVGCGGGGGGGASGSGQAGAFTLQATSATFAAVQNGATPASREIALTLTGGKVAYVGAAYLQGQTPASWLGIELTGSGTSYRMVLTVLTTSLPVGDYTTTFAVGTADSKGNVLRQQNFSVSYSVNAGVALTAAPASTSFVYGDTRTTQDLVLNVQAPGQQWTLASNAAWLQVPTATQTGSASVAATLDAGALAPGQYTATVRATSVGSPAVVASADVVVVVTAPTFTVAEETVLLGGADGRSSVLEQTLHFALTTGNGVHPYVVELRTDDVDPWLTADKLDGFVGSSGASVTLKASRVGRNGGTRTGQVRISTTVKGVAFSEVRPVTFNTEANRIVTTAEGVGFSQVPGREVLQRRVRVLSTLDRTNVPWQASSSQPWLTVTSSGTTGGEIVLTADPTGLSSDTTHFAEVTVTSPDASVENSQRIRVGLHVASTAPTTTVVATEAAFLAANPVEPLVAVTDGVTGSVSLYQTHTGQLIRTLPAVVARAGAMAWSGDGRTLYVHDLNNLRVVGLAIANGATVATYDATTPSGGSGGFAIAYVRPQGFPMLVTPGSRLFDVASGADWSTADFGIAATAVSLAVSPDQTLVVPDHGASKRLTRSALAGGTLRVDDGVTVSTAQGRAGEACVSANGDRIYTASGYPYEFPATSIATGQVIQRLPGSNYPNAVQCVWNGLVVGGIDGYYAPTDIWVYDGPSGTLLAHLSSTPDLMAYRSLADRGLAVSADATRLVSVTRPNGQPKATLMFQTLPRLP